MTQIPEENGKKTVKIEEDITKFKQLKNESDKFFGIRILKILKSDNYPFNIHELTNIDRSKSFLNFNRRISY